MELTTVVFGIVKGINAYEVLKRVFYVNSGLWVLTVCH
jgi:hypothetical protein